MLYPKLKELETKQQSVEYFKGYNHNLRIGDGEFYDMKNMTSAHYPILSPRGKRGLYVSPENPQGMIAKDGLCYVDGRYFVMNEYRIDMGLSVEESDCPKQLVSMGAYVIILPDKKYINTADITDYGDIEATVTTGTSVSFTLGRADGTEYAAEYTQAEEPEAPENMALWIDTSQEPHTLKQWSQSSGMWVDIATTYVKIGCTGIGKAFEQYDGVTITGLKGVELTDSGTGQALLDGSELEALEGSAVIWAKGDDYIVVTGMLSGVKTISNTITLSRKMPVMDFVVESKNRLWGCRYGQDANGNVVNELYASKQGSFKNWECFMSIATDSYRVTLGTDGQFTGAITHGGYPIFFKENCMHKVYGDYPANFQVQDTACRGVQKGCQRSLAIVNEVLYYKARSGVCAYDGSLPVEISGQMGEESYADAVAGVHGNKYYISMRNVVTGGYHLFVYDASKGMWHREDDTRVEAFCSCGGEMYFIDHADKGIKTMFASGSEAEKKVEWMVQTGVIGVDHPDKKYLSRITVRMSLDVGTRVRFFAQYDSMGQWEQLHTMTGTNLRTFSVPIRPRRCDHLRLRIEGEGDAKIFSIVKTIESGSDY